VTDGAAPTAAGELHRERAARHAAERDSLRRRARRLSWARLLAFALLAAAGLRALSGGEPAEGAVAAVALATFGLLVVVHGRAREAARWADALRQASEAAGARVRRDWAALPADRSPPVPRDHPYADDLDVVGRSSLFRLLDSVSAYPGRGTLAEWLLAPAPPAVVRERQAAVAELAPLLDLRESLAARALLAGELRGAGVEPFLRWAEGEPWLTRKSWLVWATRVLPALTVVAAVLQGRGVVSEPLWIAPVALGLALTAAYGRRVQQTLREGADSSAALRGHTALFTLATGHAYAAPLLRRLSAELSGEPGATRALARLDRVLRYAEARYSAMAHAFLHALTLWDFHVVAALEYWQRHAGSRVRGWLAALGEIETLAALAALRHDNPDWAFPEMIDGEVSLVDATALGHPLIAGGVRVDNDVTVGPAGTFLMVTGSNMSGKSTLLRAIGANVVLAQAGAPVCARALRLPPVALYTSMRVQDALDEGVSLFMAELRRLKLVVDAARAARASGTPPVLYLLDEILHGTNTSERQVAARRVIGHLIEQGAIGAVSTHDLELAGAGELAAAARAVHFSERFENGPDGPVMTFDYRLRPGVATSVNALKLVEMMGLG